MSRVRGRHREGSGSGFTLIELLIVVAIIGIIAAVAIPNLMNALDKGKQKRSMADLKTISTAVEMYSIDNTQYPVSIAAWASIKPHLTPFFIRDPPNADGWNSTWDTTTDAAGLNYTMASYGKDAAVGPRSGGQTQDFDCDIVFRNGQFYQWPEGSQS
ncbi:MAG: type II secretion system protein GspG [Acidobacteria bacterium]|nr:type II secretion system protein GspG [Acidobacteriota bacterium]